MLYTKVFIKHLKGYIRRQYLEFLVKNGSETRQFYKYALHNSNKLIIYKSNENDEIIGIIGFKHCISLEKCILTPHYPILYIPFVYSINDTVFKYIVDDITEYSLNNNIPCIYFSHIFLYQHILIELNYINSECCFSFVIGDYDCIKCFHNDPGLPYHKTILNVNDCRHIYTNEYYNYINGNTPFNIDNYYI